MTTTTINNRYMLQDKLGEGNMGTVYRAYDRLTLQPVALKSINVANTKLALASSTADRDARLALAREFQALASLRHPYIISVLDYGFDDKRRPFFTMDLLEPASTILEYGSRQADAQKVALLVQVLQALTYLHQRGILHRDLKPANVLVSADGKVKLLDFGLSAGPERAQGITGTLTYMAPEILQEQIVSRASDLYAVGVIAYELFLGRHPFDTHNPMRLMASIVTDLPDVSGLDNVRLASILSCWLAKKPAERYQTAQEVITLLYEAFGVLPPEESSAIRESFLQASQFVGRKTEFAMLTESFHRAMQGEGAAWLIGGESGIGKSRLVDELRIYAMVEGAMVLRGLAVETGGFPYQPWRAIVERLALSVELSDLEASILKELVPDMDTLLGRDIPESPPLTTEAAQQRLNLTIVDIIQRQAYQQPVVLIFEDLQWATNSLDLLRSLIRFVKSGKMAPLLIVANYRSEESPTLPDELPGVKLIHLKRLSDAEIAQLSVSMLGDAGKHPGVLNFFSQETEGNVFFLIEIVRALAEDAGQLHQIGHLTLPSHILTGGIQRILARRLSKIPAHLQAILKLAAVIGREIDMTLLRAMDDAEQIDSWLLAAAEAAILDVRENRWFFAHDKIREAVLSALEEDEAVLLHRQVAQAIETVYADKLSDYVVALAEHWRIAGDRDKERHYVGLAGEKTLLSNHDRALVYFERAKALMPEGRDDILAEQALLTIRLGWAYEYVLDVDRAERYMKEGLALARRTDEPNLVVTALNALSWHMIREGNYDEAHYYTEQAETLAREVGDSMGLARALRSKGDLAIIQGDINSAENHYWEAAEHYEQVNELSRAAGIWIQLTDIMRPRGEYDRVFQLCERALLVAEQTGDRIITQVALVNLARAAYLLGDYLQAKTFCLESIETSRQTGSRWGMSFALYHAGRASFALEQYDEARQSFCRSMEIALEIRLAPLITYVSVGMAMILMHRQAYPRAHMLLKAIMDHPSSNEEIRQEVQKLLQTIEAAAGPISAPDDPVVFDTMILDILADIVDR